MGEREKIVFADDLLNFPQNSFESLFREIEEAGHEIVGTGASVEDVRKIAQRLKGEGITPTLAILDGNMPLEGHGAAAAAILRKIFPKIKVVALSSEPQTFGDKWWNRYIPDSDIVTLITEHI